MIIWAFSEQTTKLRIISAVLRERLLFFNEKQQLMRFLDKRLDAIIASCSASVRDVKEHFGVRDVHTCDLLAKAFPCSQPPPSPSRPLLL